jgi:hypothetical protein
MDTHAHSDRRLAAAKADLVARLDELQRRLRDAKHRLDIGAWITAHPLISVGGAFALGAVLGMGRRDRGEPDGSTRHRLSSTVVAALGAIGLRLAKDFAARYLTDAAKSWLDQHDREPTATERAMSRDPNVESFVKH